ncbi:hypothetical protein JCM11641_002149 [Rhodosporidiobolus odoratus]
MRIVTPLGATHHISSLSLILLSLLAATSLPAHTHAKHTPAKRHYTSHRYYVLELDQVRLEANNLTPADVADALGAEHVEQVGELRGHYLVRVELNVVEQGDEDWAAARQPTAAAVEGTAPGEAGLRRRTPPSLQLEEGKRDKVLERYDLLRRNGHLDPTSSFSPSTSPLSKRTSPIVLDRRLIRSLEAQVPRRRAKRDLPVLPPSTTLLERMQRRAFLPLTPSSSSSDSCFPSTPLHRVARQAAGVVDRVRQQFNILDPLWSKQWHLVNGVMQENSINVTGVWEQGVAGTGVNVAIVDDGLDMHSDDLAANFHAEGSWDYNDNTPLPEPRLSDDQHGTRCAGEIAAVKNDVCGVGVAHGAGIAGIRILSASISDADEASSLNYGYQSNDIYSCSWGPPDDGRSMEAPGRLIVKAMLNGVQNGRKGKGSIFVFASGNGGAVDDQCNFDGYTNSLMSITVGAIDRKGLHPFYSEACSANMVVTYSSGSGDNIHTTDVGKRTCTDRHGGTSAAAPIAAGIFALVLEIRPDLTWRDMQHLCVRTAVQINPNDPDWQMTASGRPYNHKYGFGKLDAWAIVDLAKRWELVKPQAWWTSPIARPINAVAGQGVPITESGAIASLEVTRAELAQANFEKLEHVTITVFVQHQRRGNIEVELDSPRGMKSILARPRRFDESPDGMMGWVFMSVKHWDEDPVGTWTLRVRDRQSNGKTGTFHSFSIQLWGSSVDASLATPYQLPMEYDDEPSEQDQPLPVPVMTTTEATSGILEPTKAYVKPTVHLPDDHAEATGEAHSSFADGYHPTSITTPSPATAAETSSTTSGAVEEDPDAGSQLDEIDYSLPASTPSLTSTSTSSPLAASSQSNTSTSLYDQTPGYLAGLSSLVGSTTWLFVAFGTIIVFIAAVAAFFLLRRHRQRKDGAGGVADGRGGYAFAPATDFEDDDYSDQDGEDSVPMSAMERGRVRLSGGGGGDGAGEEGRRGSGRTRELFNAFALNSDDEDENESDSKRPPTTRKRASIELQEGPFRDDPDSDDDAHLPRRASAAGSARHEPLTVAEQERRAREEFSD